MKKKNGFTLIELLAVIVVLSIIMVIAVISVSKVIETSRKNAFVTNAKIIEKAVKKDNVFQEEEKSYNQDSDLEIDDKGLEYNVTMIGNNIRFNGLLNDKLMIDVTKCKSKTYCLTKEVTAKIVIKKGIKRIEEGSSVTIKNNAGYMADDYIIYGNSVQNGVPTPDSPVTIKSLGENSDNLIDYKKLTGKNITLIENGIAIDNSYATSFLYDVSNLKPNTVYTFSRIFKGTMTASNGLVSLYNYKTNTFLRLCSPGYGAVTGTFTTPNDIKDFTHIYLYGTPGEKVTITNIMMVEGNYTLETMPKYVSKGSIMVESRGKNVVDINSGTLHNCLIEFTKTGFDLTATGKVGYYEVPISLIKTNRYIVSFKSIRTGTTGGGYTSFDDKGVAITGASSGLNGAYGYIAPTNYNIILVRFYANNNGNVGDKASFNNVQIEEGSKITEYEPYKEPITTTINLSGHEPLRKIGDISDYIDYKNGRIVRNIGKKTFIGDENWYFYRNGSNNTKYYALAGWANSKDKGGSDYSYVSLKGYKSNYFVELNGDGYKTAGTFITHIDTNRYSWIYFTSDKQSLADWKSYLSEKNNIGMPVETYYQLETPTYEPIKLPGIELLKGDSTIKFRDINLNASNVKIEHLSY